jgi:hypothetical protein
VSWKAFGAELSWPDLRCYSGKFPEGLRKTLRIVSGPAEIGTEHFQNTSTEHYRYGNPLDGKVWYVSATGASSFVLFEA